MNKILSKLSYIVALLFVAICCTTISANAQYGGNVITFGSSTPNNNTSTPNNSTAATTPTTAINNCQAAQVTTSVSGSTVTANLCGIKAGNVININNLSNTDIESLQITFDQNLNSGTFQIVKISESLTLPNLNGKYITAYEILTTNFNRSIIKSIKFTYRVPKAETDKYNTFNAFTANSPWVNSNLTRESDSGSFARFTSVVGPFQQYALVGVAPVALTTSTNTTNTSSRIANLNTTGSSDLIRTGGSTAFVVAFSAFALTLLLIGTLSMNKKRNLTLQLQ